MPLSNGAIITQRHSQLMSTNSSYLAFLIAMSPHESNGHKNARPGSFVGLEATGLKVGRGAIKQCKQASTQRPRYENGRCSLYLGLRIVVAGLSKQVVAL